MPNTYGYDSCVVIKMINRKNNALIAWHVDDLKILHVDSNVVDGIVDMLDSEFGKEAPMNMALGKVSKRPHTQNSLWIHGILVATYIDFHQVFWRA